MERKQKLKYRKVIFFIIATICLVLAYIGIAMPGIPGTPFILLTAYFYLRSSGRMYRWLLKQKLFARLINKFKENKKIPLKLKITVLLPFWISIIVAEIIFIKDIYTGTGLAVVALLLTFLVLRLKELNLEDVE